MIRISKLAASVKPSATLAAGAKARQLKAAGRQGLRLQPRRAGLQHAQAHLRRRREGRAAPADALHARRAARAEVKAAIAKWYKTFHGLDCSAGARHRLQRGEALAPQRPRRDRRAGRRGHHPDAVLGQLLRPREHDRRDPGAGDDHAGERVQDVAGAAQAPRSRRGRGCSCSTRRATRPAPSTRGPNSKRSPDAMDGTDAAILSDEIYEQLTYGDAKPTCVATLRPGLKDRTITISGASKSYAMTGWRMGWAVAPAGGREGDGHHPEPGDELPVERQPGGAGRGARRRRRSASRRCGPSSPPGAT